jgi:8-oxo-dGTP pyrophosphatase MutT (NUDIX family)
MAFNYKLISQVKAAADRVRVVLPYEDQYLMETLQNPKWPQNFGKRRFVGGGIDEGETPEQAAARELMEELGAKIDSVKFKYLGLDPNETKHKLHYLQLDEHDIKPGKYKTTVGSDPFIYLSKGMPSGDDYMGPELKALIKQVKEAMHKLAAPVPPEEVTGEKPYVRPEYLEPEQLRAIDPQTGLPRGVAERLLDIQAKEKFDETWKDHHIPFFPNTEEQIPDVNAMVRDLRAKYNLKPLQSIADVPAALKDYQQNIKPIKEKFYPLSTHPRLHNFDNKIHPQEYADWQHKQDQGDFPLGSPQRTGIDDKIKQKWHEEHIKPLEKGLESATNAFKQTNRTVLDRLQSANSATRSKRYDLYEKNRPSEFMRALGADPFPDSTPEMKRLLSQEINAENLYGGYKPIAWASSLPLRAAMGYAMPSKPVITSSLPTTLGQTAANSLKAFPYADRGYGGFYPRVDPNKPATKPNIPYSPASHMDAGAPMLDRRFSRTDVNAAKPAAPVQQPAPKPVTPNLPAISTAKPVGGGRNY